MLWPSEQTKHGRNKTPNKVKTANTRQKKKVIFLLERFYAVFKVYRVGTVPLKFVEI